jgi:hypothetical protein
VSKRMTDPLDELRHADPVRPSRTPSDSRARVWARIEEATMEPATRSTTRRRPIWAFGALAAAATAVVVMAVIVNLGGGVPTPSSDPGTGIGGDPGTGIGSCVESYSPTTLASRDFAFDGTVVAIDGEQVTFDVNSAYAGEVGDSITLTATGMTGTSITSAGGPSLSEGERYLVAGDDVFAWGCGFTQPYNEAVASEWAEATR